MEARAGELVQPLINLLRDRLLAYDIEPYAHLRTGFTGLPQAKSVEQIEALLPVPRDSEDSANVS